jgi:hypothetical protein
MSTLVVSVYPSQLDAFKAKADLLADKIKQALNIKVSKFKRYDYLANGLGHNGHDRLIENAKLIAQADANKSLMVFSDLTICRAIADVFHQHYNEDVATDVFEACKLLGNSEVMSSSANIKTFLGEGGTSTEEAKELIQLREKETMLNTNMTQKSHVFGIHNSDVNNLRPYSDGYIKIPVHLTKQIKAKMVEAQSTFKEKYIEIPKPNPSYLPISMFNRSPSSLLNKHPKLIAMLEGSAPLLYFVCDQTITSTYLDNLDNLGAPNNKLLLNIEHTNKSGPKFIERFYSTFDGKSLMSVLHEDIGNLFKMNASFKHFNFSEDNISPVLSKLSFDSEVMAIFKTSKRMTIRDFEVVTSRIRDFIGENAIITAKFVFSEELTEAYEVDILEFFDEYKNRTHVINLLPQEFTSKG